jgi:hypothetical protein
MEPLPAPLLRRQTETDPYHEAVGEALHDATIRLWSDLWQKLERYEQALDRLLGIVTRLETETNRLPWFAGKTTVRRRLTRARSELEALR